MSTRVVAARLAKPPRRAYGSERMPPMPRGPMNRYERRPVPATEAEVEYGDGEFRIVRPGSFVRCAVTGVPIPLDDLRYWNVALQEAYATPQAKLIRLGVGSGG